MADVKAAINSLTQRTVTSRTQKAKFTANEGLSKYKIDNMMYPSDLMNTNGTYGGNYVVFYINVSTESKLLSEKGAETIPVADVPPRERGFTVGANWSNKQVFAAQTATVAGGAILGSALGIGGMSGPTAALAEIGVIATAATAANSKRAQKRLKSAIAMHVPNQLSTRYGVRWDEDDTFALSAVISGGTEIKKALESGGKNSNVKGVAGDIITNLALSKGPNAGAVSAATGLASNPKKDQVFKGVDFRSFQFEYQFFPRDENEAANVLEIIKQFKYHMHPEFKDGNNFLYIYPSEFDIVYYSGGKENENINRLTSCVLTEMNVNYTPNGNFTTFANGMPTQINVQLSFRELALLSKELIDKGM